MSDSTRRTALPARILAVVTSTGEYERVGYRTGLWLGELTHFHDVVTEAGHQVDIVSITGGDVPLDPESLSAPMLLMGGTKKRYQDRAFMDLLRGTKSVADVDVEDYDAIYLTGGHGTMFDFTDARLAELVGAFAAQGKIVSSVCHGAVGLLEATVNGQPLVKGRELTGFSWNEEKVAGRQDAVPFNLQERLTELGADYTKALAPMVEKVVVDEKLVTGQNPTSAKGVAKAVLELLEKKQT